MSEINDVWSMELDLSEEDLFYAQKKKLFDHKGFGVKEKVHLKSSMDSESLNLVLEKMLQIARIIKMDKVELYFSDDACSSVGNFSPRNEVAALNWILSLVDKSASCRLPMKKDVLKDLRDAIISRINEFRVKQVETRVDKNYRCEKENHVLQWVENSGVKIKLQIAYINGYGRGAIANEDLNVGDMALEVPVSIIISEEYVYDSDMYPILDKIDGISSETMLLLWSMKEKHNPDSKFKAYFDALPENFNTGLSFGMEAIMTLDGTLLLEEILQAKELLRQKYDELSPILSTHPDVFPPELYTWECYMWACELWYSNSMQIMFVDGKIRTCLIPIAGFLNHSLQPHIVQYGKIDASTNSLKFPVSRPCSKGEQCYLSYGNYSSSHLIMFYGFLPKGDNPYDVIPLDIDVPQADIQEDFPESSWTEHMLRGTWFSNNYDMFYYGLPSPLLDYFRRARGTLQHSKSLVRQNLENEMEILQDLRSLCDSMMENLGGTDSVAEENPSWDVKLASAYKQRQRKIMSSILDSCSAGLILIEHELSKCTR